MHKIAIPQYIIDRVVKSRGRLHAFDQLLGPSTALLVVDLQNTFMLAPYPTEVPLHHRSAWLGESDPFGMPPDGPSRTVVKLRGNHSLSSEIVALRTAVGQWLAAQVR